MGNTAILEVAIGLTFIFSLMALLVTQTNNIVTNILNLRAEELKKGLQEMITDGNLQARLLAHPIIKIVDVSMPNNVKLTADAAQMIVENAKTNKVNSITPETFIEAMVGLLIHDSEIGLYKPLQTAIHNLPTSVEKSELRGLVASLEEDFSEETMCSIYTTAMKISDKASQTALLQAIQHIEDILKDFAIKSDQLVPLIDGISRIDDPKLKSALKTILTTADDMNEARKKLENWFNDGMSRVSDTYRRRLQLLSLVTAFLLTVILNVDTLYLGRTLWEDPELRQAIAETATEYDTEAQSAAADSATQKTLRRQAEEAQETIQGLLELQLPIGWQFTQINDNMIETSQSLGLPDPRDNSRNFWNFIPTNNDNWVWMWFQKIVGFMATTIAVAQGAPFWFDLLNNLTNRYKGNSNSDATG